MNNLISCINMNMDLLIMNTDNFLLKVNTNMNTNLLNTNINVNSLNINMNNFLVNVRMKMNNFLVSVNMKNLLLNTNMNVDLHKNDAHHLQASYVCMFLIIVCYWCCSNISILPDGIANEILLFIAKNRYAKNGQDLAAHRPMRSEFASCFFKIKWATCKLRPLQVIVVQILSKFYLAAADIVNTF